MHPCVCVITTKLASDRDTLNLSNNRHRREQHVSAVAPSGVLLGLLQPGGPRVKVVAVSARCWETELEESRRLNEHWCFFFTSLPDLLIVNWVIVSIVNEYRSACNTAVQSFSTMSKFSLVYLLAWYPPLYTPYISLPNHYLLFAAHDHTIATCFAVVLRLLQPFNGLFSRTTWVNLCQ